MKNVTFIVGLVLTIGAFIALLTLGSILNPPPYQVAVVIRDVPAGSQLSPDMLTLSAQRVSARVASVYVLADEVDQYIGATVKEPMHPGDPLTKARLVRSTNPAADRYAALGLEDPDKTLMVIPVTADMSPDNIMPGDRVDLIYAVGQEPVSSVNPADIYGQAATSGQSSATTAQATPQVELPLAKLVFSNLLVARIHREQQPNPSYTGAEGESPYIEGVINGLEVVAPRDQEELLGWAIQHGKVRVALVSPNATAESISTMGMTWGDLIAWFEMSRQGSMAALGGQLAPNVPPAAGAASVLQATVQAQTAPVSFATPVSPAISATGSAPAPTKPAASTPAAASTPVAAVTAPKPAVQPTAVAAVQATQAAPAGPATPAPSMLASGLAFVVCGGLLIVALIVGFMMLRRRGKKATA